MRLLACGAHADDVELGSGGTLALAAARGHDVYILDLTEGEIGSNGDPQTRAAEAARAAEILGVSERHNARLPDGHLQAGDEEQRRVVIEWIRKLRPDLLLVPPALNRHPDHTQAHRLCADAAFLAGLGRHPAAGNPHRPRTICQYMERVLFAPSFLVRTDEFHAIKREALLCYESQFQRDGDKTATLINNPDFLEQVLARDRHYGGLAGCASAEPFLAQTPLLLDDLSLLLSSPDQAVQEEE